MGVDKTTVVATSERAAGRRWWALATVALGISLVIVDATVVNVALPTIIRDLHLSAAEAEWMNAVYSLLFASLLLATGRLADLFGRRRMFLGGMVLFLLASVGAALSVNAATLIAARLVQGVGASMILPTTLSTVNALFTGRERSIAFAVWGSTIGGVAALGPLVGGWLTTDLSWRWAFGINLPLGVLIITGIGLAVPETRDETTPRGFDLFGVVLSAVGLGGIVFALIEGHTHGWLRQSDGAVSPVPIAFLVGLALMVAFVLRTRARSGSGRPVLVDLRLLHVRSFRYGSIAALVVALGEFGLLFTLPLLLQNALGLSALGTGWLITALALGTFLVSGATPQLTQRWGGRAVVRLGLGTESLAVAGLALTLTQDISGWAVAGWLFLYGVGVGMATAQLTSVILAEIPVAESGQASGLQSTVRQLGSALGVAILGTLLVTTLGRATTANLRETGMPATAADRIAEAVTESAGSAIPGLAADPATRQAADAATAGLLHASKVTTGIAAGVIAVGLAATWALPYVPPPAEPRTERRRPAARNRSRRVRRRPA